MPLGPEKNDVFCLHNGETAPDCGCNAVGGLIVTRCLFGMLTVEHLLILSGRLLR